MIHEHSPLPMLNDTSHATQSRPSRRSSRTASPPRSRPARVAAEGPPVPRTPLRLTRVPARRARRSRTTTASPPPSPPRSLPLRRVSSPSSRSPPRPAASTSTPTRRQALAASVRPIPLPPAQRAPRPPSLRRTPPPPRADPRRRSARRQRASPSPAELCDHLRRAAAGGAQVQGQGWGKREFERQRAGAPPRVRRRAPPLPRERKRPAGVVLSGAQSGCIGERKCTDACGPKARTRSVARVVGEEPRRGRGQVRRCRQGAMEAGDERRRIGSGSSRRRRRRAGPRLAVWTEATTHAWHVIPAWVAGLEVI
ncbi:hypothetical protein C8Q80DRAFT_479240 [Daedaleopsis nitida]|nr:hypothetical protein C8Q80DRAFT_479240 [Daedaleopsis nitida]